MCATIKKFFLQKDTQKDTHSDRNTDRRRRSNSSLDEYEIFDINMKFEIIFSSNPCMKFNFWKLTGCTLKVVNSFNSSSLH